MNKGMRYSGISKGLWKPIAKVIAVTIVTLPLFLSFGAFAQTCPSGAAQLDAVKTAAESAGFAFGQLTKEQADRIIAAYQDKTGDKATKFDSVFMLVGKIQDESAFRFVLVQGECALKATGFIHQKDAEKALGVGDET